MGFVHSYSKLADFENCPKKFAHKYIWKDAAPFDANQPQLVKGRMVDEALSTSIDTGVSVPAMIAHAQPLIDQLRQLHHVRTKYKIGLDTRLHETDYFQGEELRWRTELDYIGFRDEKQKEAEIIDWKTGKASKDLGQLALYAAVILAIMPWVERVRTRYVWVEHKKSAAKEYTNADFAVLWARMDARANAVDFAIKSEKFPAVKNPLCAWCPIRPDQCTHKPKEAVRLEKPT